MDAMRRRRPAALLAVLGLLLLAAGVAPAPAAAAAVRDVQLTFDGPVPKQLTVEAGDTVRFVNADTFVHRVVSDSDNWSFDTGTLPPRGTFTVEEPLAPGTYTYLGAGLDSFDGSVLVPGATASRSPAASPRPTSTRPAVPVPGRSPSPAASPSASPAGSPSPAPTASPSPTGGTGVVQGPPPLAGSSFGGFDGLAPTPAPGGPAPVVAPDLPDPGPAPLAVATPDDAVPELPGAAPVTAVGELPRLTSPVAARRFGLPLVLAALGVLGVASLLTRLLLAEAPSRDEGLQA